MSLPTVAVSAPGKVLLAGGYLALDQKYTALVFGLSARINVIAGEIHTGAGVQLTEIVVDSPQFLQAQWKYGYVRAPDNGGIKVTQLDRSVPFAFLSLKARPVFDIGETGESLARLLSSFGWARKPDI